MKNLTQKLFAALMSSLCISAYAQDVTVDSQNVLLIKAKELSSSNKVEDIEKAKDIYLKLINKYNHPLGSYYYANYLRKKENKTKEEKKQIEVLYLDYLGKETNFIDFQSGINYLIDLMESKENVYVTKNMIMKILPNDVYKKNDKDTQRMGSFELNRIGELYFRLGEGDLALKFFDWAIQEGGYGRELAINNKKTLFYQLSLIFIEQKEYTKAKKLAEILINDKDNRGKDVLAYIYANGFGVEKNINKAIELWKEIADIVDENGIKKRDGSLHNANFNLAVLYLNPSIKMKENEKTRNFMGMILLGHLYEMEKNYDAGFIFIRKAYELIDGYDDKCISILEKLAENGYEPAKKEFEAFKKGDKKKSKTNLGVFFNEFDK